MYLIKATKGKKTVTKKVETKEDAEYYYEVLQKEGYKKKNIKIYTDNKQENQPNRRVGSGYKFKFARI